MYKDRFIDYIQSERCLSPHTVSAYKKDLEQFLDFLAQKYKIASVQEANHHIIRSWIVDLMDASLSARSVNRKISTLKTYFKYLKKEGYIKHSPMQKILSPKTSKRLPAFIEEENINLLLDEFDFGEGFTGNRNKLVMELFYATGMRLNELINIKISDIDFYNSTLKVLGKRNKERIIPLNTKITSQIKNYIQLCETFNPNQQFLFITEKGKKMYAKLVYRLVNTHLSMVTSALKKSPHTLRHTFATHMLNRGADINAIKEILGHSNLSATQVYTHNTIEKLKSIYKITHPKA